MKKNGKYYLKKKLVTEYWKWIDWEQPTLTANTTSTSLGDIVVTASSNNDGYSNIYGAMDGVKSGTNQANIWMPKGTTSAWWQVKLPYESKITGLSFYNGYGKNVSSDMPIQGRFYTSSSKDTPIGDSISTSSTAWEKTEIQNIPTEGILTDTIYFQKTGGGNFSGIGELEITAQRLVSGNIDNYDYETERNTYNAWLKV